jgi:ribosome maturation factor RimP
MSYEQIRKKIEGFVPDLLTAFNGFLVEVIVKHDGRGALIRVLIDTDAGITIDECAQVSHSLGRLIDAGEVVDGSYRLEVSSPGIDQPLKLLRQYAKNVGRRYTVKYRSEGVTKAAPATMEHVEGDHIRFRLESGEALELPFEAIIEAKEILPW